MVSVICLCYNHMPFVVESIQSVLEQTYPNVELIVVDDGSTDGSKETIENFLKLYTQVRFLNLPHNTGMCTAFNKGLRMASGEFVIDLAADDVLHPERILKQVKAFEKLDSSFGVVFSDAEIMDENGKHLRYWYNRSNNGRLQEKVPSGNIYTELFKRSFICSPTMMTRKAVYDELGGYDESLNYEDFDFWVRSARTYKYHFLNEALTRKRQVRNSDSSKWYSRKRNPHLQSTLKVCEKALRQNQFDKENKALSVCIRYHLRQAVFTENYDLVMGFARLLERFTELSHYDKFWVMLAKARFPMYGLYRYYLRFRYGNSSLAL